MKKVLVLFLVMCLVSSHITVSADGITNYKSLEYQVISEQFPDAYILIDYTTPKNTAIRKDGTGSLGKITATVFVEEVYVNSGDTIEVLSSRLLSKDEVDDIGVENFSPLEYQKTVSPRAAVNTRGTLTLSFEGHYNTSGNSTTCNLFGSAKWSGFDFIYSSVNNAAIGNDFCGITWGGDFDLSSHTAWAKSGNTNISTYLSQAVPNSGIVWEFLEYIRGSGDGSTNFYMNDSYFGVNIKKNNMTGGGNTASACMSYIHTYQAVSGSIGISGGAGGVSGSISLSGTDKQWTITCIVTGIPY